MMNKQFKEYLKSLLLADFFDAWYLDIICGKEEILYKESEFVAVIDLSKPNMFKHLKLIYDAANDNLYIEYKELNNIVNDLEISISLESSDIHEGMLLLLKNLVLKEVSESEKKSK